MISYYVTVVGTKTPMMEITDLLSVLKGIRDGAFSEKVYAFREALESGNSAARTLKISLPAFKPSGVFSGLTDDSLKSYSQFVHLDYDHLTDDEMITVRDILSVDKYVYGYFISPSMKGYKVFFKTNAAHSEHLIAWTQVRSYMDSKLGIESDPAVKNIGRNVFVSDDPDTFINQDSEVFIVEHNQIEEYHFRTQTSAFNTSDISVEEVWNRTEAQRGYSFVEGNRNNYVRDFGCSACRWGIDEVEATQYALNFICNGFDESEIKRTMRSAYRIAASEAGTISYGTTATPLPKFGTSVTSASSNPLIPESVYETLPSLLREACKPFKGRRRDVFFTGAITAISGSAVDWYAVYDENEIYPNLYSFIAGLSSSGKGALSHVRGLMREVRLPEKDRFNIDLEGFDIVQEEYDEIKPQIFIPANTSGAMLKAHLEVNNGYGIISSTEGKTLQQVLQAEFGAFLDDLLKGSENESIEYSRKGHSKKEQITIEKSRFAVMLSGVPEDLEWVIRNQSSGLTSRFLIYSFPEREKFRNPFASRLNINEYLEKFSYELNALLSDGVKREFRLQKYQEEQLFAIYSKEDEGSIGNEGIHNLINRSARACFKIAMLLTILRGDYTTDDKVVYCHPQDWINALLLGNEVYLTHARTEVQKFRSNLSNKWTKGTNSIEYLIKNDKMTKTFTTGYAIKMNAKYTGVSEKTTSVHLKEAVSKGIVEKIGEGRYRIAA